jgi:hypothetical protein
LPDTGLNCEKHEDRQNGECQQLLEPRRGHISPIKADEYIAA